MFFYELDETAERETFDKAGLIDDPYVTQEQGIHAVDWQGWPRVEYPDVYNYLPSVYTGESLHAYKGYNSCINGRVSNMSVLPIMFTPYAKHVIASVKHPQSVSGTPPKPWIAAKVELKAP